MVLSSCIGSGAGSAERLGGVTQFLHANTRIMLSEK
jgi:hypothetical protein